MLALEFLNLMTRNAKGLAERGIAEQVKRDAHLSHNTSGELTEADARAAVVAFINQTAYSMGVDYALTTRGLMK